MRKQHEFLWLDLATTGLIPSEGVILEWAVVLANDVAGGDLAVVEEYTAAIRHEPTVLKGISPRVKRMHESNGLLAKCLASSVTLEESERFLLDLIGGEGTRGVTLAGRSVHFDLAWIRHHMPSLSRCLLSRVFDVSTLTQSIRTWFPEFAYTGSRTTYRALDDVMGALEEAREWRRVVGL